MSNKREQAIAGLVEIQSALEKADSLEQALPEISVVKDRLIANNLFAYWLEVIETSFANRWQGYAFGKAFNFEQMMSPSKTSLRGRRDDSEKGRCKMRAEIYSRQIKIIKTDGQPEPSINHLLDKYLSGRKKCAVAKHTAYIQTLRSKYPKKSAIELYEIAKEDALTVDCPFGRDGDDLYIKKNDEPYNFTAFKNNLSKAKIITNAN